MAKQKAVLPPDFETIADTSNAAVVTRLAKLPGVAATDIERLKACRPKARCGSEACSLCRRSFRKHLLQEASLLGLDKSVWTRASLIPQNFLFGADELHNVSVRNIVKCVQKRLERSGFADSVVIGALDISWNEFSNSAVGYQLHLYLLINQPFSTVLDWQIRMAFSPEPSAYRGFNLTQVRAGDFFKVLSYAYKNVFNRRSQYEGGRPKADGSPGLNTRTQSLTGDRAAELDEFLLPLRVGSRLILRNIKRVNSPPTKVRLDLKKPLVRPSTP